LGSTFTFTISHSFLANISLPFSRIWNCSLHQGNFHWFRGSKFHSWVPPFTLSIDCTPGPFDFYLKYKCNTIISLLNCFSV
jgi:hypothetical protein